MLHRPTRSYCALVNAASAFTIYANLFDALCKATGSYVLCTTYPSGYFALLLCYEVEQLVEDLSPLLPLRSSLSTELDKDCWQCRYG